MKKDNKIVGILSKIKRLTQKFKNLNKKELLKAGGYVLTVFSLCVILFSIVAEIRGVKKAYCLYVNENPVIAVDDKIVLEDLLEEIKNEYKTDKNTVSFSEEIKIKKVNVEKDSISSEDEAEEFLYENLKSENPILKIKAVSYETQTEKIYFDTRITNDSTKYQGVTEVKKDGENGEKDVLYEVVTINGVFSEKSLIKETVIKEPVDKIVVAGTMIKPKNAPTGTFERPYGGNISSRFGSRWGRKHHGIDYTGNTGDPIYAADGGEIIFAGWDNGGYGNMVKIKHNDGYETFYAHLNSVKVEEGQMVSQGDVIGTLGNTGRSTGAHLHFEIRKDGVAYDPQKFTK